MPSGRRIGTLGVARAAGLLAVGLTTPVLARYLGPDGLGIVTLAITVIALGAVAGDLGMPLDAARTLPVLGVASGEWLRSALRWRVVTAGAIAAVLVLAAALTPPGVAPHLFLAAVAIGGALVQTFAVAALAAEDRVVAAAIVEVLSRVGGATLSVVAVVAGAGPVGVTAAVATSYVVAGGAGHHMLRADVASCVAGVTRFECKSLRLPLASLPLVGLVYARVDTVVLALRRPLSEVGVYALQYRLVEVAVALTATVVTIGVPLFASTAQERSQGDYAWLIRGVVAVSWPALGVVSVYSSVVVRVLGGSDFVGVGGGWRSPSATLAILMAACSLMIVGQVNAAVLVARHRERALLLTIGVLIALYVPLLVWLAGEFGILGAAAATVIIEVAAVSASTRMVRSAGVPLALSTAKYLVFTALGSVAVPLCWRLLVGDRGIVPAVASAAIIAMLLVRPLREAARPARA